MKPTSINPIERADLAIADAVEDARDHPATRAAGAASELADQPPLIALSIGTIAMGLGLRDRRLAETGGRMLAAHLLATFVKGIIKDRIDRTRPHMYNDDDEYRAEGGDSKAGQLRSFPSGHSAGATAIAAAVARNYPAAALPGFALAGAVGVVQVPRSQHFASDVVAGIAIGAASEWVVDRAIRGVAAMRHVP